ncbi:MAG: hypothetical protein HY046_02310 [Acidobacteria bacterium]|nr:hypothetical protein [Acidobacteriota bacterium]
MAKPERIREVVLGDLSTADMQARQANGWRLVAVEWERDAQGSAAADAILEADVPYGLRVASDCLHLEEDPSERDVLLEVMELIVQDLPLSRVAEELNRKNLRTRHGMRWNPISVFHLLPRLIEVGPRVLSSEEWIIRRNHIFKMVDPDAQVRV